MSRLISVFVLVAALYGGMMFNPNAQTPSYQYQLAGDMGFYGLLTLGMGVLMISGGIDLSVGSVVGLGAVTLSVLLNWGHPPSVAITAVLLGSLLIGLAHGLLVIWLRLPSILVTLCGLFIYRGIAKAISFAFGSVEPAASDSLGSLTWLLIGDGGRNQLPLFVLTALLVGLLLHATGVGRRLFAIGTDEEAARQSGVWTKAHKILAHVICSCLAGVAAVLYHLGYEVSDPGSAGQWLELYAITGAVLGGCSLRGGKGTVAGMLLAAALLALLHALSGLIRAGRIGREVEYGLVGIALLVGMIINRAAERSPARPRTETGVV